MESEKTVKCIHCALHMASESKCSLTGRKVTPFSDRHCKKAAVIRNYEDEKDVMK